CVSGGGFRRRRGRCLGRLSPASGAAGAVSPRVPSPPRGEGYSLLQHEGMGEGVRIHRAAGNPLTPTLSPNGERGRTGFSARSCAAYEGAWGSSPAEQPLDIGELELHVGRPPVIALAGIGRRLHLTQESIHLF